MLNNHQPISHELEVTIGINNEPVVVHCTFEDSDYPPEIHKVMFENIDIMGCLSGEMIDELEAEADVLIKKIDEIESLDHQISQWENKQNSKLEHE